MCYNPKKKNSEKKLKRMESLRFISLFSAFSVQNEAKIKYKWSQQYTQTMSESKRKCQEKGNFCADSFQIDVLLERIFLQYGFFFSFSFSFRLPTKGNHINSLYVGCSLIYHSHRMNVDFLILEHTIRCQNWVASTVTESELLTWNTCRYNYSAN